jgi:hypothetical protein
MMAKGLNFEHGIKTNFFSTSSLVLSVGSTEELSLSLVTHSFLLNQNLKANSPTWFSNPTLTLLQVLNWIQNLKLALVGFQVPKIKITSN